MMVWGPVGTPLTTRCVKTRSVARDKNNAGPVLPRRRKSLPSLAAADVLSPGRSSNRRSETGRARKANACTDARDASSTTRPSLLTAKVRTSGSERWDRLERIEVALHIKSVQCLNRRLKGWKAEWKTEALPLALSAFQPSSTTCVPDFMCKADQGISLPGRRAARHFV